MHLQCVVLASQFAALSGYVYRYDVARDALAATTVFYAFAAWQWLQWPAAGPSPAMVPPPHVAAAAAAAATLLVSPLLSLVSHPAVNYGVKVGGCTSCETHSLKTRGFNRCA